jgi:hypothetical protein
VRTASASERLRIRTCPISIALVTGRQWPALNRSAVPNGPSRVLRVSDSRFQRYRSFSTPCEKLAPFLICFAGETREGSRL